MTTPTLKRQLGFWDSIAINIGIVIGVGIFRVPSEIAKYLQEPSFILIAWILGGVISLLGVMCFAELSSCFPRTGGMVIYLREAYGDLIGFLFGWMELFVLRAGSLAGVAYVFSAYLKNFIVIGVWGEKLMAMSIIMLFTFVNILGIHYGRRIQNVLSALKVLTLLVMSVLIYQMIPQFASTFQIPTITESSAVSWFALAPALIPVLWGYGGWHESTFMSGEFKDTRHALPRSLIVSIIVITSLYVFINSAYLRAMTPSQMLESNSIAADIFTNLFGYGGLWLMSCAVMISASGALNSYILTGARIPVALGEHSQKLSWLAKLDASRGTPVMAYLLNSLWASILILWGSFEELLFFTGFSKWLFFTLVEVSVFIHRRKKKHLESFNMLGYPWVPILFSLVAFTLFCTTVIHAPRASIFGGSLLLLGIPLYFLCYRK